MPRTIWGERSSFSFLTEEEVRKVKAKHKVWKTIKVEKNGQVFATRKQVEQWVDNRFPAIIARELGVDVTTIRKIRNNRIWRHVK
jgi:hypothetical protein